MFYLALGLGFLKNTSIDGTRDRQPTIETISIRSA